MAKMEISKGFILILGSHSKSKVFSSSTLMSLYLYFNRAFLNSLYKELCFEDMDQWYKITHSTIIANGGSRILEYYHGSVHRMLVNVFKEYTWYPWLFDKISRWGGIALLLTR
jgi:hypothetical protein